MSASGPVTVPASVPLSFPSSGKLSEVDVSIGQSVSAGQVLAKLDTTELQIAAGQAQAALVQQQANLTKVAAGATPEAVAAAQAQVAAAQTTLDNAQKSLVDAQALSATAITSYAALTSFPQNVILLSALFAVIGTASSAAWAAFGSGLRRFLKDGRHVRGFNIVMALLLVASLYPVFAEAWH